MTPPSSSSSSQSSFSRWWTALTGTGNGWTYSSGTSAASDAPSGGIAMDKEKKKLAVMVAGATFLAGSCYLLYHATQHPLFRAWKQGWKKYYSLSESERAEILRDLRKHHQHSSSESSSSAQQPTSSASSSSPAHASSSTQTATSDSNNLSNSSGNDEVSAAVEKIKQYLRPSSGKSGLILLSLETLLIESSDAWYQLFSHAAMELFGLDDVGVETDEFRAQWWREGLQVTYERLKARALSRAGSSSSNIPSSLPYELFQAYATYHFADFLPFLRLNPHAESLLKAAKSTGARLALVTNMDRNILQLIFEMFPLLRTYFQLDTDSLSITANVFCAGDSRASPSSSNATAICAPFPSPALLSTAVAAMGAPRVSSDGNQCLFLASSSFEVQAAAQTNCFTLSSQTGSSSPSDRMFFVTDEPALTQVFAALAVK